ncbi:MAG: hypothetical protein U1G07_05665 [Verrucomicrobiota bacterium]
MRSPVRCNLLWSVALLMSVKAACAQGTFMFYNRVQGLVDARFVLPTDPPGSSSVGPSFQIQLFGGTPGTPIASLIPLEPPTVTINSAAPAVTYGYVNGTTVTVPNTSVGGGATILLRVFDGPSWKEAGYRLERVYSVPWLASDMTPEYLPMGTTPLVLAPVPEPGSAWLIVMGLPVLGLGFSLAKVGRDFAPLSRASNHQMP